MPGQGKIPMRAIRVDDATWRAAQEAARANDESVSDVVRRSLVRYGRRAKKSSAKSAD